MALAGTRVHSAEVLMNTTTPGYYKRRFMRARAAHIACEVRNLAALNGFINRQALIEFHVPTRNERFNHDLFRAAFMGLAALVASL
jgi:hypothetical protein